MFKLISFLHQDDLPDHYRFISQILSRWQILERSQSSSNRTNERNWTTPGRLLLPIQLEKTRRWRRLQQNSRPEESECPGMLVSRKRGRCTGNCCGNELPIQVHSKGSPSSSQPWPSQGRHDGLQGLVCHQKYFTRLDHLKRHIESAQDFEDEVIWGDGLQFRRKQISAVQTKVRVTKISILQLQVVIHKWPFIYRFFGTKLLTPFRYGEGYDIINDWSLIIFHCTIRNWTWNTYSLKSIRVYSHFWNSRSKFRKHFL